jgi:DNA mismatch repair protein MutS
MLTTVEKIIDSSPALSPGMAQYMALKERHQEYLLFYRMGDFYELFFEDAVQAAAILDIALTKRGKIGDMDIPMCGVPVHAAENYLQRLIAHGVKVAICEQLEDPAEAKKRGSKSVVKRDVVRIVTPGTITEEGLIPPTRSNYLACLAGQGSLAALAWLEITTGEFAVTDTTPERALADLARLQPSELLMGQNAMGDGTWQAVTQEMDTRVTAIADTSLHARRGAERLKEFFGVGTMEPWGEFTPVEIAACGALLDYVLLTQKDSLPRLDAPKKQAASTGMAIDAATRRNLELVSTLSGTRQGSLLAAIDRTRTAAGARLLARWLCHPLTIPEAIHLRQDAVEYMLRSSSMLSHVQERLREMPDLERALNRLLMQRGGPRDLQQVAAGLHVTNGLRGLLEMESATLPEALHGIKEGLSDHAALVNLLRRALKEECPLLARDGGFIVSGYHAALDEFRTLRDESRRFIAEMQARYVRETGISMLKIKHNNVLGYYIEITRRHEKQVPEHFIHRQTMKDALRYSTVELGETERKITEAADRALKIELELFEELLAEIRLQAEPILAAARAIAALDVFHGLALLAKEQNYCRPDIDDSCAFSIRKGRHPVVEQTMRKSGTPFIGNDCDLGKVHLPASPRRQREEPSTFIEDSTSESALSPRSGAYCEGQQAVAGANTTKRLWLLTGPNMAGKSTFLRQNALIAILAQIGSFVPAETAHIGIVDRLFSRVGAADDLARGRSTFMVEMVETATILHQATERSLVILDEIGRGTATFDGLSIAWAVAEHLHNAIRCRGLFATHYHELTHLAETLPSLACHTMKVREWKGEVIFLHEVAPGTADRSYGIHVARLAGLPQPVIGRAQSILKSLEDKDNNPAAALSASSLPLFAFAKDSTPSPQMQTTPDAVRETLKTLEPDTLTPREALDAIYRLRGLL